ncbi:TVP38/TMEM64 family protein [Paenibacillus xerothermodurans]|nr:TVP38/TMEM64 family protein [Paenibacillus xerothermodurans]
MLKKWLISLGYVSAIIVMIMYKDEVLHWLEAGSVDLVLVFGIAVLLAMVPVLPYGVVAGVIGAKYGPVVGGALNVFSSTFAAALLFLSLRLIFQEQGKKFLAKYKRIDQFTQLMEQHAFVAVLTARLIPFIPALAVNVYTALSRMSFGTFFAATLIGKIPVMFVFAIIGDQLVSDWRQVAWTALGYALFLFLVWMLYRSYQKRAANKSKAA